MKKDVKYAKLTKKYEKPLMDNLKGLVAIDSTYDEATVSAKNPFGEGVSKALKYFEELAKKDGFKVTNYDNKVVEAIVGEGKKNITIMAHADIVPVGTGWSQDPFQVVEKKGVVYGRGVADDKGPLLSAYYGLLALKDNNLLGNYRVRFLVGGNEESGSLCMEHYFHTLKKEAPTYGFSPDSDFPVVFAEKAIMNFEVRKKVKIPGLISLKGGTAFNSVIELATMQIELNDDIVPFLVKNYPDAEILTRDDIVNITFHGKAAHGSTPQLGVNAGMRAIKCLADYTQNKDLLKIVECYSDVYGKGCRATGYSHDMGQNSLNVGLIDYKDEEISLVINFRFVETCNAADLKSNIIAASRPLNVKFSLASPLLYFKKDSPLIKTLVNAYRVESGDYETEPLAIGGGTYAKETSNTVAFGLEYPGWDSKMHSVGEQIKVEALYQGMAIYARAIHDLGQLIENEN
ncbi:MAG: Sapep family Mn(2+)-dependent dipeptidase [Bacilli bacterium]|nr:Sapep family Mn(2+)-dependent dipeptidase [Bacilli bacterium]MBO4682536.1 Sapep family Mn(2+)-dependent dipeptidase [Bacilli bacterium]